MDLGLGFTESYAAFALQAVQSPEAATVLAKQLREGKTPPGERRSAFERCIVCRIYSDGCTISRCSSLAREPSRAAPERRA
jgi:hypothetical protein